MTDGGPRPGSDGGDAGGIGDQAVPGLAGGGHDRFVPVEDAIGELGLAEELPDVFGWIELGRFGRQFKQRDIVRQAELVGGVPSSLVEDDDGVGSRCDTAADLVEMMLHCLGSGRGMTTAAPV